MRKLTFSAAMVLLLCGLLAALSSVMLGSNGEDREKEFIVGLVLILGSGVFAILFLGTRRRIE
jgi:hypothetical protein